MRPERIAELLVPYLAPCNSEPSRGLDEEPAVLSPVQLQSISTYIDLLRRWNLRVNLTSIRSEEEIVTRHFGESIFAGWHLFPKAGRLGNANCSLADLGSGAGFPGVPIKLCAPEVSVTLIESNQKKAAFLGEVIRALTLTNIDVRNLRAETVNQTFDVVALRAVERFSEVLPIAFRLLTPKGQLALLIGSSQEKRAHEALPDLHWEEPTPIPESESRILLVGWRR